ncbi:MAG: hypothetical protein Q9196_004377 [Gyalolechia fulgens]
MASSEAPVYQPKDAISASARTTMILGGAGLFLSAVENSLTRQNVTGWGVFTRTGGTIAMFAAIGGTFGFVRTAAANLREKDDAYNPAIAGFFAGGIVGLRMRSFPAVLGFGAVLAIIQGTHEYTGGKLSGYERDPSVDEYERKEQLRRNRRRPIEETLQELGEGRAYKNSTKLRERVYGLKSTGLAAAARNTALTQCLTDINDLKNEIGSQANRTAPHDQRTYSEVLNGLNEQLQEVRSEIAPKRKFAFKPKASAAPINQSSAASPSPVESSRTRPVEEASETLDPQPVSTTGSGLGDSEDIAPLDGTISDQWDRIHDFNWLKAGHSPNWSILEPEKRKSPDQWRRLQGITEGKVDEVLRELTSTDPNGQNIVSIQ